MNQVNITIRGLDEEKYRKVKSIAAESNVTVSEVVNEAFVMLIEAKKNKWKKINSKDALFTGEGRMNSGVDTDVRNADKYIYR